MTECQRGGERNGRSEDSAAYVLDAMPTAEHAEFEEHLLECLACRREVAEYQQVAVRLGGDLDETPSPELRAAVLAEIARTPQEGAPYGTAGIAADADAAPDADATPKDAAVLAFPAQRRTARTARLLAVAATTLFIATLGLTAVVVDQRRQLDDATTQASRIERIVTDADRRTAVQSVSGGGRATAIVSDGEALILADGVPELGPDRTYQLWVGGADGISSAGLLPLTGGSGTEVVTGVAPGVQLLLSVEPAGGSEQPTSDPIWFVGV